MPKEVINQNTTPTGQEDYRAFISYKHVKSTSFAEDFELSLKRYAKGPFEKPDRIFRDEQFLKPGSNLSAEIKNALVSSRYLILLASVEAANSVWVNEELRIWCVELARQEQLIIVLTSGQIAVNSVTKEIDWGHTDALPHFLKDYLPALPLFVDLSHAEDKKSRTFSNTVYKSAINSIAATLRDTTPNKLAGKEWKLRRLNMIIAWSTAIILLGLLTLVVVGNFNLNAALTKSRSRELAALSQLQDLPEAMLSAGESVKLDENKEGIYSLLKIMAENNTLYRHVLKLPDGLNNLVYYNNVLFTTTDHILTVHRGANTLTKAKLPDSIRLNDIAVSSNGQFIGSYENKLWDAAKNTALANLETNISALDIDDTRNRVIAGLVNGKVYAIDLSDQSVSLLYDHGGLVTDIALSQDGFVTTALTSQKPLVYYGYDKRQTTTLQQPPFSANAVAVSPDGNTVVVAFENRLVQRYSLPRLELAWTRTLDHSGSDIAFHPTGKWIAVGSTAGSVTLYNQQGSVKNTWSAVQGRVHKLIWIKDTLVTGGSDGWIKEWLPEQVAPAGTQVRPGAFLYCRKDSLYVADSITLWNATTNTKRAAFDSKVEKFLAAGGPYIAVAKENSFSLFDVDQVKSIPFPEPPGNYRVEDVAISTSGEAVAVCWLPKQTQYGDTGKVAVWYPGQHRLHWLKDFPEFPEKLTFYENDLLAATGKGVISVWDLKNHRLLAKSRQTTGEPIQHFCFQGRNRLVTGMLMGRIEIRNVHNPGLAVSTSTLQTGSNYGLTILEDKSILSIDVNGIKWFDSALNYLGPVINVKEGPLVRQLLYNNRAKQAAVRFQDGRSVIFSLDVKAWMKASHDMATPQVKLPE